MFLPEARMQVWLYGQPTDMRKQFDGLAALAKHALGEVPTSGDLFVFINRRRTYLKVLYFDTGGYCLWAKRLEQGQFHWPGPAGNKIALDVTALKLLIAGIDVRGARRYKRYGLPAAA